MAGFFGGMFGQRPPMMMPGQSPASAQPGMFGGMFGGGQRPPINNAMLMAGLGLMSGKNSSEQMQGAMQGIMSGTEMNQNRDLLGEEKKKSTATTAYLKKLYPDLSDEELLGVVSSPELLAAKLRPPDKPEDMRTTEMKNFEYGQQNPEFAKSLKAATEDSGAEMLADNFKMTQDLRKEASGRQEIERFNKVKDSYEGIRSAAKQKTGAGDVGLVISYMKLLDPGSAVQGGEYATAQNTAGVPDIVRAQYNKLVDGDKLSDQQRSQFVTAADAIYKDAAMTATNVYETYNKEAGKYGIDPTSVTQPVPKYEPFQLENGGTLTPAEDAPGTVIWRP
ncbi:MAG: hypothetical protein H0U63_01190 [Burkholderiales bacterium]|nr:hypothetical protein [Burkholderiales bacterium]